MKKVLILFCGGTIIMKQQKNEEGILELKPPKNKEDSVKILQEIAPKLKIKKDNIEFIANIDSTEIQPEYWDIIINRINEKYEDYDGFVITHGTDTLAYTASALSIGLENINKPVVLTGSQIPGCEINNDATRNLVNSVLLAKKNIRGVYIVFDERIILGARATKISESKLDAFRTVNNGDIGEITVDINLDRSCYEMRAEKLNINTGFESDIFVYQVTPGCDPSDLTFLLEKNKFRGIILRGYGTGNIPKNFEKFFKEADAKNFPIVINTQCLHGMTSIGVYESGNWYVKFKNVIDGYDQSIETLTVKLQHALSKFDDVIKIKKYVHKNFCGEINQKYL